MINDVPIVKWHDGNYELDAARDLVIFGSKCYIITKDFGEKQQNIIPIHPEFDDDLVPAHYDAYLHSNLANW